MEEGSDEGYGGDFNKSNGIANPGGGGGVAGTDRYLWHAASWVADADDPARKDGARLVSSSMQLRCPLDLR